MDRARGRRRRVRLDSPGERSTAHTVWSTTVPWFVRSHDIPPPSPREVLSDATTGRAPGTVLLIAHTHWDREWYQPAVRFQSRLVAMIDALLAALPDAATPFLLDGQTIVLADYLAVRPERAADIARALAAGAFEAGPWYVLGDNLIPSAEAIVRNFEAGRRWLRRMGASAPRVAYCPDTFGHPSAMPIIAQGFGCDVAVVWRGFGGRSFPATDTAWWEGPDGGRVLLYHLPPDGYEFGSALPTAWPEVQARWDLIATTLGARNQSGVALLLAGADHHAAQPNLSLAIARLDREAQRHGSRVLRCGLATGAGALWQAALQQESQGAELEVVRGELRDSYGYAWTLQGTLATRAHFKRRNARLERALLTDLEPWGALAWLHAPTRAHGIDANGALTLAQIPVLTQRTWEALLRTHPHDTLCGCSIDAVAEDAETRQRRVASSILELRAASLACALAHDPVIARARTVKVVPPTVVRNRTGRSRGGIAELRVMEMLGDVSVGPNSEQTPPLVPSAKRRRPPVGDCVVQPMSDRVIHTRRESPQHYPDNDLVREHRLLAWVPDVPSFGIRVISSPTNGTSVAPPLVTATELGDDVVLDNGRLQLIASARGLTILQGDRRIENALVVETTTDLGDSYTPSLRGPSDSLKLRRVRIGANGPLRASVQLLWLWRSGREQVRAWTELMLDADAAYLRCDVRGWNARRDHQLQLVWRTDVPAPSITADAAFGPVERLPLRAVHGATPFEVPPAAVPLHRWLSTHDAARGATLFSDGLAAGEVGESRVAVTLLRAIGELSRADLPERPGHAGWPHHIPQAQCPGPFAARVGLMLHGSWTDETHAMVEDTADRVLSPLVGESWRDLGGNSRTLAGPALCGTGVRVSAIGLNEDGTALVLRAVNVSARATHGQWTLPPVCTWRWRRCRLDGTPLSPWAFTGNEIAFEARPREVVTVQVERDQKVDD